MANDSFLRMSFSLQNKKNKFKQGKKITRSVASQLLKEIKIMRKLVKLPVFLTNSENEFYT